MSLLNAPASKSTMPNEGGWSTFPILMQDMASTRTCINLMMAEKFTDALKVRCRKFCGSGGAKNLCVGSFEDRAATLLR